MEKKWDFSEIFTTSEAEKGLVICTVALLGHLKLLHVKTDSMLRTGCNAVEKEIYCVQPPYADTT